MYSALCSCRWSCVVVIFGVLMFLWLTPWTLTQDLDTCFLSFSCHLLQFNFFCPIMLFTITLIFFILIVPSVEPNCRSSSYRLVLPSASPLILKVMLILLPPIIPHASVLAIVPFIIIPFIFMPCGVELDAGDCVTPSTVEEVVTLLGLQVGMIRRCCKEYGTETTRLDYQTAVAQ